MLMPAKCSRQLFFLSMLELSFIFILFSESIVCDVPFKKDQKLAFLVPAKKAFGEIKAWDETAIKKVCSLLEVVPPSQILKLSAKAVSWDV